MVMQRDYVLLWNRFDSRRGMNVKVCTFPDGEDPDSFIKKHPMRFSFILRALNAKDFIQFKASLLMNGQSDPIKKADLIRDMVCDISKFLIEFREKIYIQECSRIMDISS
jgi:DNA primase